MQRLPLRRNAQESLTPISRIRRPGEIAVLKHSMNGTRDRVSRSSGHIGDVLSSQLLNMREAEQQEIFSPFQSELPFDVLVDGYYKPVRQVRNTKRVAHFVAFKNGREFPFIAVSYRCRCQSMFRHSAHFQPRKLTPSPRANHARRCFHIDILFHLEQLTKRRNANLRGRHVRAS